MTLSKCLISLDLSFHVNFKIEIIIVPTHRVIIKIVKRYLLHCQAKPYSMCLINDCQLNEMTHRTGFIITQEMRDDLHKLTGYPMWYSLPKTDWFCVPLPSTFFFFRRTYNCFSFSNNNWLKILLPQFGFDTVPLLGPFCPPPWLPSKSSILSYF